MKSEERNEKKMTARSQILSGIGAELSCCRAVMNRTAVEDEEGEQEEEGHAVN